MGGTRWSERCAVLTVVNVASARRARCADLAALHERQRTTKLPLGRPPAAHFLDVVGGQVGGLVGWLSRPSGAPVADDGTVVGDDPGAASAFGGVVVQVGALGAL